MTKALHVPADPEQPVRVVNVRVTDLGDITRLVGGGFLTTARFDRDSVVLVDDEGIRKGLPTNERATTWMLEHSDAARQGRMRGADPGYQLYGNAVMLGDDAGGEMTDVPARLVQYFGVDQTVQRGPSMEL